MAENGLFVTGLVVGLVLVVEANLINELKEFAYIQQHENNNPQINGIQAVPLPRESFGWPKVPLTNLGQISAVSINLHGHPVIFHRGKRAWNENSFNDSAIFQEIKDGPIKEDTIITLDRLTGEVLDAWGAHKFYLPHGLTVDHKGFIWLTDVALHQVFKFTPHGKTPVLALGQQFSPGGDLQHFCMPTSVAVATDGHFFVADGYCNNRILKYNADGQVVRIYPQKYEFLSLTVPHSLALLERQNTLCIADRENMRVVCVNAELYDQKLQNERPLNIQIPDLGRVFAITSLGDLVFAVNGPTSNEIPIQGFTISPFKEMVLDSWAPTSVRLHNPHGIAISKNGTEIYVVEIAPNRIWKFDTTQWTNMNQYSYIQVEK